MRTPPHIIEFLRSIVGSKVSALEKGLAWLKENLSLRLPRVSRDILKLSAVDITELASLIGAAASLGRGRSGSGNRTAAEESGIMVRAFESYRAVPRGGGVVTCSPLSLAPMCSSSLSSSS